MSETEASPFDVQPLRRGLRDLAALSALPIIWTESDPRRIAESLAEALLHMLHLELVYVVVRDRAYEIPIEVAHTARGLAPTAKAEEIGRALEPWLNTDDLSRTPSSIANPVGNGMTRIICPPFGIEARGGVLVACSPRADFPSEVDRLLLSVAANQVAILLDRRRTEDALRESEERFRGTFENAAVGIAHTHPEGRFLRVNEKFCAIVGYPREELLEKTWRDISHPDDLAASIEVSAAALRGESPVLPLEKRYVRKDGSLVWGELVVSLQRDTAGDSRLSHRDYPGYFAEKAAGGGAAREREAVPDIRGPCHGFVLPERRPACRPGREPTGVPEPGVHPGRVGGEDRARRGRRRHPRQH